MTTPLLRTGAAVLLAAGLLTGAHAQTKYDYPTLDRVRYVQNCMRDHPGSAYEMTNKCVCVIDHIANRVPAEDFTNMSTALDANSIGGERGAYIRDAESLQDAIKRFRVIQTEAKKSCFILPP